MEAEIWLQKGDYDLEVMNVPTCVGFTLGWKVLLEGVNETTATQ